MYYPSFLSYHLSSLPPPLLKQLFIQTCLILPKELLFDLLCRLDSMKSSWSNFFIYLFIPNGQQLSPSKWHLFLSFSIRYWSLSVSDAIFPLTWTTTKLFQLFSVCNNYFLQLSLNANFIAPFLCTESLVTLWILAQHLYMSSKFNAADTTQLPITI